MCLPLDCNSRSWRDRAEWRRATSLTSWATRLVRGLLLRLVFAGLAVSVMLVGPPIGLATTTTVAGESYSYDGSARLGQGLCWSATRPTGRASLPRAQPHRDLASRRVITQAGVAAEEGTTIYRAVGPNELADLQNLGRYRVPPGGTEGK